MIANLKDLIRAVIGALIAPFAVPLAYLTATLVVVVSLFARAQVAMYVLVAIIPLPTLYYRFHDYPLGKDLLDILYFSVIVGIFVNKKGFETSRNGFLLFGFVLLNYVALWNGSLTFGVPLPISTANEFLRDWKNYAEMICLYFLVHNSIRSESQQRTVVLIMASMILLICVREFRNFSQGGGFSYDKRVEGPFWIVGLGANHMGAFVAHYGALLLGVWMFERDKWRRRLVMGAMIFSIHSLFFSYSRGAYLGLVMAIVFLGVVYKRSLLLIVLALAVTWQAVLPDTVVERITMTEESNGQLESSAAKRIELWDHATKVFKDNPVFGIGFGAFGLSIPQGAFEGLTDTHNFYLRTLSEQGLIGLASFAIVLFAGFRSGWRLFRTGRSEFHKGLGLGFAASIVAVCITNMFGDRWSYFSVGSYLFIAWGMVDRALRGVDSEPQAIAAAVPTKPPQAERVSV